MTRLAEQPLVVMAPTGAIVHTCTSEISTP
jgi:hypothetical protein